MADFLQMLETSGFSQWVRETSWSFPTILLLHTYGMGIVVGVILAIDLSILGFVPALPIAPLRKFLPLVWAAFWVNAVTGTMLLVADTAKLKNPDFGVKMAFIVLAVVNQRMIQKRVFGGPESDGARAPFPAGAKMLAVMSLVCWVGAITAGRLLAYVGGVTK